MDAGTPSFLTLTADPTDPINNPFTVAYDATKAVEADIKEHTINYTVRSKDYAGIVDDLSGSFKFTIECPDKVISSTLDTPTASTTYDLASGKPSPIAFPIILVNPSACFSIDSYVITNSEDDPITYVQATATNIEINSSDLSLVGLNTLKIKAKASNGEFV